MVSGEKEVKAFYDEMGVSIKKESEGVFLSSSSSSSSSSKAKPKEDSEDGDDEEVKGGSAPIQNIIDLTKEDYMPSSMSEAMMKVSL